MAEVKTGFARGAALAFVLAALVTMPARADQAATMDQVVPEAERARIDLASTGGPAETRGVLASEVLGALDLVRDFPQMAGYQMRARVVTLDAGGVIAVHQHESRPAVAYLLEGEITEVRGKEQVIAHGQGSAAFEQTGLVHWWENRSDRPVKVVVVDIVPKP